MTLGSTRKSKAESGSIRSRQRARDRKFNDSPLEGSGFEPSVPGHGELCQTSIRYRLRAREPMLHPGLPLSFGAAFN